MILIVRIPDEVAGRLQAEGVDLERRALEALVLEEFRAGRMTKRELRQALDFETRAELDQFFKAHGVNEGVTLAEVERDLNDLGRLGL